MLIIIVVFIIFVSVKLFSKKEEFSLVKDINIIDSVYEKISNNIDREFLNWINDNYNNSLSKLNKKLEENEYNVSMWHDVTGYSYLVLNDLYNKKYEGMDNIKIIDSNNLSTFSFVGDVSLADNWYVMPKYDSGGINNILSKDILDIMIKSDLMVVNSEFTVSNRGTPLKNKTYTFKAKPERLSIYDEMGVDLVTLANNHVYDYGRDAFLDMLDSFDEKKIPHIGAGHNIEEAKKPFYFIINGYKFAFVNATRAEKNIMTPGATENSEGVFRCYDETNMVNLIKEIRGDADYVIAIIHYGKEFSHDLEEEQISGSRHYIDAGADAVVGHHAHVLQGVEIYKNKPIIYNLGNFIFNEETVETAIFQITIDNDGIMDYYIIPAIQKEVYTDILNDKEKQNVIDKINNWNINAWIDESGKIIKQ